MAKLKLTGKGRLSKYGVKRNTEGIVNANLSIKLELKGTDDVCLDFLSETDRKFADDMLKENILTKHKIDLKDRGIVGSLGIDDDAFEFTHVKLDSIDLVKKFSRDEQGLSMCQIEWTFNFAKDMDDKDSALTQTFWNRKEEMQVEVGKNRNGSPKFKPKLMFIYFNFKFVQGG